MATKPTYCTVSEAVSKAGKSIILSIWDETGSDMLALAGQQDLTINRSADTVEANSKDAGGWKSYLQGQKEWSIDISVLYVFSDASHKALDKAFNDGTPVCCKVSDISSDPGVDMYGGVAYVTDLSLEAPTDDALTASITLSGNGPLQDLSAEG